MRHRIVSIDAIKKPRNCGAFFVKFSSDYSSFSYNLCMLYSKFEKRTPEEELQYIYEIYGRKNIDQIYKMMGETFNVLQQRAQTLLSLITITLTISGFSGPQIARSSQISRISITFGLAFVLLSALILMTGPLQLKWSTQIKSKDFSSGIVTLLELRNFRTRRYHIASICLIIGLVGYVSSLISFLMTG